MALTNFILTVAGVGAAILLLRGDVKHTAGIFRRNVRQIQLWLEEASPAAPKTTEKTVAKELESQNATKVSPKDEK